MKSKRTQVIRMLVIAAAVCLVATECSFAQQSPTRPGQRGPGLTGGGPGRAPARGPAAGRGSARGPGRGPGSARSPRRPGAGPPVVSGGARAVAPSVVGGGQSGPTRRAGAGSSVVSGEVRGVTPTVKFRGPFEPVLRRDVTYGEVPELGGQVAIKLKGPMAVPAFLDALSLATGWNIAASVDANKVVLQFWTKALTPRQAVAVLKFNDIYYEYDSDSQFLFVMTLDEYLQDEYGELEEREFSVQHVDVKHVMTAISPLVSPGGSLIADPGSSTIWALDTKDNLDQMERVIAEIDVLRLTQPFVLIHVDASTVMESVGALLTEGGQMTVDPRSNALIVTDRPERIDRIAEVVKLLDHELEMRPFRLVHVGASLVVESVGALLTEGGQIVVDPRSNTLIVTDRQEGIERIAKFVKMLDLELETRSLVLTHVDASMIVDSVGELLSEGGRMTVDERSNTLIVTDRSERIDRMAEVVNLLDLELETRTWTLDYADPVEIASNVSLLVPESMGDIVVNEAIHQITVTATPYRLSEIDKRIEGWDEKPRQVQIEAYLATVSRNIVRDMGINWSYATTINGDPITAEVGSVGGEDDGEGGLDLGALVGGQRLSFLTDNFAAVINTLDTSGEATILAHPRITVQDGAEALFENTTQVPFASSTTTFGNNLNNSVNSNTQIDFIDVGTVLTVTPRITSDRNILLDISAEDSSFESVIILSNGQENTLPQKTQNKAKTQVLVGDRQTIVLGGLRTTNNRDAVNRVPILGGLPFIGRAFRSTAKGHQDRELLIFLTPTIVDERTQPEAVKLAEFDDEVAATMRSDAKTTLGRLRDKMKTEKKEITVSIGQHGGLLAEGEAVSLEDLRLLLTDVKRPRSKKVILRAHPAAPVGVSMEIMDVLMERGFKIKFDDVRVPIVPRVPQAASGGAN